MYFSPNETFTRLTVTGFAGRDRRGYLVWACRCECGNESTVKSLHLLRGMTKSCGCYIRDITIERSTTHGQTHSPEYQAWLRMIQRCTNQNRREYPRYGGRGIRVCPEWRESFEEFYAFVGPRPDGHSLDRIDNNGDYAPGNVRWATSKTQGRNRVTCKMITHDGVTATVAEWAERLGIPYTRLSMRLRHGMPTERALTSDNLREGPRETYK